MQDVDPKIRSVISRLLEAGFQISPAALEILKHNDDPDQLIDQILEDKSITPWETPILEPEHFHIEQKELLIENETEQESLQDLQPPVVTKKRVPAEDVKDEIRIIKDPTAELKSRGIIDDFIATFHDRYYRIKQIIGQRIDGKGIIDIRDVTHRSNSTGNSRSKNVKIVGMVTNKIQTKSGNIALALEDPTGQIRAIIQQKDPALMSKAQIVLLDQVICIEGAVLNSEMLIVKDLFLPDIPVNRKNNRASEDISAAFISDIHFGSRHFLDDVFRRFTDWLRGKEGDGEQVELAQTVKYLIINGDLIDGIGIYPNQLEEIILHDLDSQFNGLMELLKNIPSHIHIIITPGNHDGVRQAIPRPSIDEKYLATLKDEGFSVTSLGCPCQVSIHGVNILVFHGDSLVDIMGALSKPELEANFIAMREMLRGRHLAPIYGKGTTFVPEPRDWLVIDQVPDILHCGHVHVNSVGSYRKTLIINSGTFQSQTDYQRLIGIEPTPGIVPLVNLHTLNVKTLNFI